MKKGRIEDQERYVSQCFILLGHGKATDSVEKTLYPYLIYVRR